MPADAGLGRILENSHRRGNYTSELAQPHVAGFEKDAADRGAAGHGTLHKYIIHNLQYTSIHSCKDGARKPTDTGTDRCECV